MGMCKGCKDVFSALEMKEKLCKDCQVEGALDLIEERELEAKRRVSDENLKYAVQTRDNHFLGIFMMIVAIGMLYFSIERLGGAVFGTSILLLAVGFVQWKNSKQSVLKIYKDCILVGDILIEKKDLLRIEANKKLCTIFLKNDSFMQIGLKEVETSLVYEIPIVLEKFINNKELFIDTLNKEEEKDIPFVEDEVISDRTHKLLSVFIVFLFIISIAFLFFKS